VLLVGTEAEKKVRGRVQRDCDEAFVGENVVEFLRALRRGEQAERDAAKKGLAPYRLHQGGQVVSYRVAEHRPRRLLNLPVDPHAYPSSAYLPRLR